MNFDIRRDELMKEKIKKILKNRIFLFVLGILISGSVSVLAVTYFPSNQVTYNNGTSGLKSTDVQGAIDELYNEVNTECAGGVTVNILGKKVEIGLSCSSSYGRVECDDGLYQDSNDKDRYVFKGTNPNNYITFNNEKAGWRIISKESDGTLKIIRSTSIGNMPWHNECQYNNSECHNWTIPASLNTYLNNDYYNSLTTKAQSQIVSKDWSVLYTNWTTESVIWTGKIALATRDDIFDTSRYYRTQCEDVDHSSECDDVWMNDKTNWWLLSVPPGGPNDSDNSKAYVFAGERPSYNLQITYASVTTSEGVKPVLYLSSNVKITGGTGTKSDPYVIE